MNARDKIVRVFRVDNDSEENTDDEFGVELTRIVPKAMHSANREVLILNEIKHLSSICQHTISTVSEPFDRLIDRPIFVELIDTPAHFFISNIDAGKSDSSKRFLEFRK